MASKTSKNKKNEKNEEIKLISTATTPVHSLAAEHRTMSGEEFEALKLSIENEGQLYPVILYRGKIVDGRHRQKAMKELGIDKMRATELPRSMTIEKVREKVIGTEIRRSDTSAQRAIRAYRWLESSGERTTQEDAAKRFAVSRAEVSRAKKLHERLGKDLMDEWYSNGYIMLGGKKYTTMAKVISALNQKPKEEAALKMPDGVEEIVEAIDSLYQDGKIMELAFVEQYVKSLRQKAD